MSSCQECSKLSIKLAESHSVLDMQGMVFDQLTKDWDKLFQAICYQRMISEPKEDITMKKKTTKKKPVAKTTAKKRKKTTAKKAA